MQICFHIFFSLSLLSLSLFFLGVFFWGGWQMEIANIQYEYLFTSIIDIQLDYMRKINSGNSLGSSIC